MRAIFKDKEGNFREGAIVVKRTRCNRKGCTTCPHGPYRYGTYRDKEGKVQTVYLGKAEVK